MSDNLSSLDMRIRFTFENVTYAVYRGVRNSKADIKLPNGKLVRVTEWGGNDIFPEIKKVEQIAERTPGATLAEAQVAPEGSTAGPPGTLN